MGYEPFLNEIRYLSILLATKCGHYNAKALRIFAKPWFRVKRLAAKPKGEIFLKGFGRSMANCPFNLIADDAFSW